MVSSDYKDYKEKGDAAISSLKWLCFNFPKIEDPKDDSDKMCNAIHTYSQNAINVITEYQNKIEILMTLLVPYLVKSVNEDGNIDFINDIFKDNIIMNKEE